MHCAFSCCHQPGSVAGADDRARGATERATAPPYCAAPSPVNPHTRTSATAPTRLLLRYCTSAAPTPLHVCATAPTLLLLRSCSHATSPTPLLRHCTCATASTLLHYAAASQVVSIAGILVFPEAEHVLWLCTVGAGVGVCALYSNTLSLLSSYGLLSAKTTGNSQPKLHPNPTQPHQTPPQPTPTHPTQYHPTPPNTTPPPTHPTQHT